MNIPKIDKFVWQELFTDSKGRTSPGKLAGFYACVISCTVFAIASIVAIFDNSINDQTSSMLSTISMQSVALFTLGGTLLGIRRFTKDKDLSDQQPVEQ